MVSTIEFEHGKETCAVEPGKFCRWVGTMNFGTKTVCTLFDEEPLYDVDGWIIRCHQCKEQFK